MLKPDFVACYLVARNSEPEYLLLKRSREAYLPGIWQVVTGKPEANEPASQTAIREVREETGLTCSKLYNVDVTMFYEQKKQSVAFSANFCGFVERDHPVHISKREHSEFKWCSLEEALNLLAFPAQKQTLEFIHDHYVISVPESVNEVKSL